MKKLIQYIFMFFLSSVVGLSFADTQQSNNPYEQFQQWQAKAQSTNPKMLHKAVLATISLTGMPSVRYMYVVGYNSEGFILGLDPNQPLGQELAKNPHAQLLFLWYIDKKAMQIRISGVMEKAKSEKALNKMGEEHPNFKLYVLKPNYFQFGILTYDSNKVTAKYDHFEWMNGQWKMGGSDYNYHKLQKMKN